MKEKILQEQSKESFEEYITKRNKSDLFCTGQVFYEDGTVGTTYHNDSGLIGLWHNRYCYIIPERLQKRTSTEKKSTIALLNRA